MTQQRGDSVETGGDGRRWEEMGGDEMRWDKRRWKWDENEMNIHFRMNNPVNNGDGRRGSHEPRHCLSQNRERRWAIVFVLSVVKDGEKTREPWFLHGISSWFLHGVSSVSAHLPSISSHLLPSPPISSHLISSHLLPSPRHLKHRGDELNNMNIFHNMHHKI